MRGRTGPFVARAALAAAITLAVLLLHLFLGERPFLGNIEAQTLNLRFQLRGPLEPGPEIALVLVDDRTIAELGQWPLSRSHFADAVRLLKADGARLVAFNLLFAEPVDPLPAAARRAIRQARTALLARNGDDAAALLDSLLRDIGPDRAFAAALRAAGNALIPFAFVFDAASANSDGIPPYVGRAAFTRYRIAPGGPGIPLKPRGLLTALPEIAAAARYTGHVTIAFDADGTPRYEYPVIGYGGEFFPSLPIEAARVWLGVAPQDVEVRFPDGIRLGDRFVPTDPAMRLLVNYYGPAGTFPTYSLVDLIQGRLAPERFAGRLVLIGGTALGIDDAFPSPFTRSLPGVERYATIIDNILHGAFLTRGQTAAAIEWLVILAGGIAAFLAATRLPVPWAVAAAVALLAGWTAANLLAFARAGLWINYTMPTLSLGLNFAALLAARVLDEERRRRRAERQRANLGRYFSPNMVEQLAGSDAPFAFDRTIDAAVMFVDIVGFTRLSERMTPAEAIALLRRFHRCVEKAVFAHGGAIDKFLGDGAMATFGPPVPSRRDAADAIACARDLAADIAAWGRDLAAAGGPPIAIGIGLHYGPVLMGDVGGERRFEFTVVGDTVNVASRLEALTRQFGATLIASEAAVAAARASPDGQEATADLTPLPAQHLRGRDGEIRLWAWKGVP